MPVNLAAVQTRSFGFVPSSHPHTANLGRWDELLRLIRLMRPFSRFQKRYPCHLVRNQQIQRSNSLEMQDLGLSVISHLLHNSVAIGAADANPDEPLLPIKPRQTTFSRLPRSADPVLMIGMLWRNLETWQICPAPASEFKHGPR